MTFSPNIALMKEPRSFKLRFSKIKKIKKITYGDSAVFFKKAGTIESLYFKNLKKFFKFFLKQKKLPRFSKRRYKVWFFIHSNFPLTKKSKNSRMGKGKGKFARWTIRVKQNNKLFESKNLSMYLIKILILQLKFKMNINLVMVKKLKKKIIVHRNNYTWYI